MTKKIELGYKVGVHFMTNFPRTQIEIIENPEEKYSGIRNVYRKSTGDRVGINFKTNQPTYQKRKFSSQ